MITHISIVSVWVNDIDDAKEFYTEKLGFTLKDDITMGDFRWCTVTHPEHPELQVSLMLPGPPLDPESAEWVRRMIAKGSMHALGLATDDCHKTFEELTAKGVEFVQRPENRPYGVEAVLRDNSGNWLVLVESKPYTPEDFQ